MAQNGAAPGGTCQSAGQLFGATVTISAHLPPDTYIRSWGAACEAATATTCTIDRLESHLTISPVTSVGTPVAPGAPVIGPVTADDRSASVSFGPPPGGDVWSYIVASSAGPEARGASGPIVVRGLTNLVPQSFTVRATNAAGTGPPSASSAIVVPMPRTTTILSSSANPSIAGVPVTLTATVTGDTPTGAVTFLDGGESLAVVGLSGTNGRPGPVHIDVPLNVFVEPVDEKAAQREDHWPEARWSRPAGDSRAIADAVRLLTDAERPVIVAGHGVELSQAESALLAYAEATSIPVATTPFGKGVFDARHPLSLGVTGRNGPYMANAACRNADVILALGTRFDDRATSAWLPGLTYSIPPTKLIHVDIDASEIGRNFQPAIGIIADARLALEQMLAQQTDRGNRRDAWLGRIAGWRKKWEDATKPRAPFAITVPPWRPRSSATTS